MNRRIVILMTLMLLLAGCGPTPDATTAAAVEATAPADATEIPASQPTTAPQTGGPKLGAPDGAAELAHTPEYDAIVDEVVAEYGFDHVVYEAYEFPATITFETAMAFYDSRMNAIGWNGEAIGKETSKGSMGVWYDGNLKSGLLFLYIIGKDGAPATALVIFGN